MKMHPSHIMSVLFVLPPSLSCVSSLIQWFLPESKNLHPTDPSLLLLCQFQTINDGVLYEDVRVCFKKIKKKNITGQIKQLKIGKGVFLSLLVTLLVTHYIASGWASFIPCFCLCSRAGVYCAALNHWEGKKDKEIPQRQEISFQFKGSSGSVNDRSGNPNPVEKKQSAGKYDSFQILCWGADVFPVADRAGDPYGRRTLSWAPWAGQRPLLSLNKRLDLKQLFLRGTLYYPHASCFECFSCAKQSCTFPVCSSHSLFLLYNHLDWIEINCLLVHKVYTILRILHLTSFHL